MQFDYVLIGGGIASATAADAIRSRDPRGTIAIFGDEQHPLYSRVLLPHVVRGRVPEEKAVLKTEVGFSSQGIAYYRGARAVSLDAKKKAVMLADGQEVSYGKLLLATGGRVRLLDVPGAAEAGISYFQTLDDARSLRDLQPAGPAVVVGGGFIALELLMSLVDKKLPVTAVVRDEGFFSRILDEESRRRIAAVVEGAGVTIKNVTEVSRIEAAGALKKVVLSSGEVLESAHVAAGIGLLPNIEWLSGSGIETRRAIVVTAQLETSVADVWAAGDVAESFDVRAGSHRVVGNWQNALFQGKAAGARMAGDAAASFSASTNYSINCFGLPIAFFGAVDVPAEQKIVRVSESAVLQFFLRGQRVVGVTCVGPCAERAGIMRLLARDEPLSEEEALTLEQAQQPLP